MNVATDAGRHYSRLTLPSPGQSWAGTQLFHPWKGDREVLVGIRASFSLGNCLVPPGSLTSPAWGRDPSPDVPTLGPLSGLKTPSFPKVGARPGEENQEAGKFSNLGFT